MSRLTYSIINLFRTSIQSGHVPGIWDTEISKTKSLRMSNKHAKGKWLAPGNLVGSLRLEIMSSNFQCFAPATDPKLFNSNKTTYQKEA